MFWLMLTIGAEVFIASVAILALAIAILRFGAILIEKAENNDND